MGFDIERFQESVAEELICAICQDVLQDPIQVKQCEHTYCSVCIREWLKRERTCPQDRLPTTDEDLEQASRMCRNFLGRLKITCDFAQEGCAQVVALESLQHHVNSCQYNPQLRNGRITEQEQEPQKPPSLVIKSNESFSAHEWFHGIITREKAEQLLKEKSVGCFLVRVSESRSGYSLSFRDSEKCNHYRINKTPSGEFKMGGDLQAFKTMTLLIEHYKQNPVSNSGEVLQSPCAQGGQQPQIITRDRFDRRAVRSPRPGQPRVPGTGRFATLLNSRQAPSHHGVQYGAGCSLSLPTSLPSRAGCSLSLPASLPSGARGPPPPLPPRK